MLKHCVTSLFQWNMKAKRCVGGKVPEIEKESAKIKELYERYIFTPKNTRLTRFVVDLLPGLDGKLYFLQVKHFECERKFVADASHIRKIKMNKGLDINENECVGKFCGKNAETPAIQELITYLMVDGYLNKKWTKTGTYLISNKLLTEYDNELSQYE